MQQMKLHKTLALIFFIVTFFEVNGQSSTCDLAEPFCAGDQTLVFGNTSNGSSAEAGPDYGCLGSQPNPAWFFLRIDQPGTLDFEIVQNTQQDFTGNPLDVDFIIYGPFTNANNCDELTAANTVACSFSLAAIETFTINNAQAGEIYIILITNFNGSPGFIQLRQTNANQNGVGSTDCSILNNVFACEGDMISLDATTQSAVRYEWFQDGVLLAETGPILNNVMAPNANYIANAFDGSDTVILMSEFNVIFETVPVSNQVSPLVECDEDNDGFTGFDLRSNEVEILNGLSRNDFTFDYYEFEADAIVGNNNFITDINSFTNTVEDAQTIFVRVSPQENDCFEIIPIALEVNPVPVIIIEDQYVICLTSFGNIIAPDEITFLPNPPIDIQLSEIDFVFQWYTGTQPIMSNLIPGETEAIFIPLEPGDYTVEVIDRITGCSSFATTNVIGSFPPESILVEFITPAFSNSNSIEVIVIGDGEYEYSLDGVIWQPSPIFENLTMKEFSVFVRDIQNCSILESEPIVVVDFPRFFTPNNDGYNDTWNIIETSAISNSDIFIFDRYGKLLKQINPNESGWDGMYNGETMPTDDYWFVIEFTESRDNIRRQFKAHFTLKR